MPFVRRLTKHLFSGINLLAHPDLKNCFLIFFCAVLITFPIFSPGMINTNDAVAAFTRTVSLHQAWRTGDLLGRWIPDLMLGFGYPTFNFYAPFFYYLATTLSFIFPFLLGFKLAYFLIILVSGLTMYLLAREFWGRSGGLIAAVAYLFAPYHLTDLYRRAAAAELTAIALLPLCFWSIYRLSRKPSLNFFSGTTLATACLILSHNITAMLAIPCLFFYSVAVCWNKRSLPWRQLVLVLAALAGGILLSTYFWLPALYEKQFVHIEKALTGQYAFRNNFISWKRLFFYFPPSAVTAQEQYFNGTTFMIGWAHLLLAIIVVGGWKWIKTKVPQNQRQILFFVALAVFSASMTLAWSLPLWERIKLLHFTGFPWRFLILTMLSIAFLTGGIVLFFNQRFSAWVATAVLLLIIILNLNFCRPVGYVQIPYKNAVDYLTSSNPHDAAEYLPIQVNQVLYALPPRRLEVLMGSAQTTELPGSTALNRRYQLSAVSPAILRYNSWYFPGWKVRADNKELPLLQDLKYGFILFFTPAGKYNLQIVFETTPVRQIAETISLGTAFLYLLGWLFMKTLRLKPKRNFRD